MNDMTNLVMTDYGFRKEYPNAWEENIVIMPANAEEIGENIAGLFLLNQDMFIAWLGILQEEETRLMPIDYDALSDAWHEQREVVFKDMFEYGYTWSSGSAFAFMNTSKKPIDGCMQRFKIMALLEASIFLNLSHVAETYELAMFGNQCRKK